MGHRVQWPDGDEVCRRVAADRPRVMLAFSGGKDSVAAWLRMRPHFERIVPVYYYLIPDLRFVERGLRYYEDWFGCEVVRVPHPSLYRMLSNFVFQPPERERVRVLNWAGLPQLTYEQLHRDVGCEVLGLGPDEGWAAVGTRACDSPQRRTAFDRWGPVRAKVRQFYPVWDWNKAQTLGAIERAGVKLPAEYRVFGRSFDGLDLRFLWGVRKHWPDDYERIREWFPLCELELKRYEFKLQREGRHGHG